MRKVEGSLAPEDIKKAKAELREAQKNVRDPVQEKIYEGEVLAENTNTTKTVSEGKAVNNQSIDKSAENGIISGRGSGNEKSTNEEHTFEKVGEIDFSDKKAIAKSLQEFELKYKDSRIEHCRVFCTNGEVYEVHGDLDTVGTTLLGDKLKGSINEHNHVTGRSQYSFSWDDIKTSVEDGSSIVMAFDEKYRYSMVFSGEKIDLDEIEQVYIDCDNEVGDINALSWQSKKIKPIKDEDYQHEVVRRVCERFGVKYERKCKV
ncbi:MAG: hypothetical protein K5979_03455 [Ruminococcus sp.]|nr:hypothetical protein [Ruminococcus sp.]